MADSKSATTVSKTIDLPEVTVKAKKSSGLSFLSGLKSLFKSSGSSSPSPQVTTFETLPTSSVDTSRSNSSFSWSDFNSILSTTSSITGSVFTYLGQSQQTKQSKYQLDAMVKQKEIALLQGEIEYNIQKLESDIELKKQELITSQKADATKNIITVAVIFGVLLFLGFVTSLLLKRKNSMNEIQAA